MNTQNKIKNQKLKVKMTTQNSKILKILFIGDIVHRIGRKAVAKVLPDLKKKLKIDLVIANGEHVSTGYGMTEKGYHEIMDAGVDFMTSGNHIWRKHDFVPLLDSKDIKVIRPANYPEGVPGRGYEILEVGREKVAIINFQGLLFINPDLDSPFRKADEILEELKDVKIKIVDFHADVTSEKVAFGLYLDGRVSAVLGTHTHVPTADNQILEGGTAYISDIGMVGPKNSVLGVKKEIILKKFLTGLPGRHESIEKGDCIFNSVLLAIGLDGKALEIKRVDKEVMVD